MITLTGNRVPGTLCHLPMVPAGGADGLPRPAQGYPFKNARTTIGREPERCLHSIGPWATGTPFRRTSIWTSAVLSTPARKGAEPSFIVVSQD